MRQSSTTRYFTNEIINFLSNNWNFLLLSWSPPMLAGGGIKRLCNSTKQTFFWHELDFESPRKNCEQTAKLYSTAARSKGFRVIYPKLLQYSFCLTFIYLSQQQWLFLPSAAQLYRVEFLGKIEVMDEKICKRFNYTLGITSKLSISKQYTKRNARLIYFPKTKNTMSG